MSLFQSLDRFMDRLASVLTESPHRKNVKIFLYVLLIAVVVSIPYSIVRHISTSGFYAVSVERERRVGNEYASQMEARMTLFDENHPAAIYVSNVGERIARQNNPWDTDFSFRVVNDGRMINAFALPGGKIYITSGMLYKLDNEAEMAAILAHEVAHVSMRHYARNMGRQMLMGWVKKFLGGTDKTMLEAGSFFTTNIASLKMGQEDEIEADYQGALYIYELDYDPEASITLVGKLLEIEKKVPDSMKIMAVTHPPSSQRLEAMKDLNETLPDKEGLTVGVEKYNKEMKQKLFPKSTRGIYEKTLFRSSDQ